MIAFRVYGTNARIDGNFVLLPSGTFIARLPAPIAKIDR